MTNSIDLNQPIEGYSNNLNDYIDLLRTDKCFCRLEKVFNVACIYYDIIEWTDIHDYIYEQSLTKHESLSYQIKLMTGYTLKKEVKLIDFINIIKWNLHLTINSIVDRIVDDSNSDDLLDALCESGVIE